MTTTVDPPAVIAATAGLTSTDASLCVSVRLCASLCVSVCDGRDERVSPLVCHGCVTATRPPLLDIGAQRELASPPTGGPHRDRKVRVPQPVGADRPGGAEPEDRCDVDYWSGSWGSQPRGTVILETSGLWVAYVRLEDSPGLSPITTVGRFATVDEAQIATDEVWASR
jgi:hypothetical protein